MRIAPINYHIANKIGILSSKKSSQINPIENDSLDLLSNYNKTLINFKGSLADFEIRELTDEEFQEEKNKIRKKINTLSDSIKSAFSDVELNKFNIFIVNEILENPKLLQNSGLMDNLCRVTRCIKSKEFAKAKHQVLNCITKNGLLENENVSGWLWKIIDETFSKEYADAKCQIAEKIINSELLQKTNIGEWLGNIIFSTSSKESAKAKCDFIDEISKHPELIEIKNFQENLWKLIEQIYTIEGASATGQMLNKIMGDKDLRTNQNVLEMFGDILYSVYSKEGFQIKSTIIDEIVNSNKNGKNGDRFGDFKYCLGEIILNCNKNNSDFMKEMIEDDNLPKYMTGSILTQGEKFYKENKDKIIEICKANDEKIKELLDSGYKINFEVLQNSDDINIVLEKTKIKETANTTNYIRMDKNGVVLESECKTFALGDKKKIDRTTTSEEKYSCEFYYDDSDLDEKDLLEEVRIINGKNGPLYVQRTIKSPLMEGALDITVYNLIQSGKNLEGILNAIKEQDEDRSIKILEEIKRAGIKGWDFSKTIQSPDGTKTHIEKFQKGNLHTKRVYKSNDDNTKTSLDYTISNTKGEKLLSVHRNFELQANKSISTLNGKKYVAEFDDDNMTAKINGVEINFKDKIHYEADRKILWELIKKTPSDLLLNFKDIKTLKYIKGYGSWDYRHSIIESDEKLGRISHELGHYYDATENGLRLIKERKTVPETMDRYLSDNKDLIEIYNEEIEELKKSISETEQKNIEYFSQTSPSPVSGLGEVVAETNKLCTTLDSRMRSLYLMRHFPRTISKTAELLGYNAV